MGQSNQSVQDYGVQNFCHSKSEKAEREEKYIFMLISEDYKAEIQCHYEQLGSFFVTEMKVEFC